MTDTDRQDRERANLARHLNQSYADAVLFVASALGASTATQAEITRLTDNYVEITTDQDPDAGGPDMRVALPGQPDEPLRQRFALLVEQARQARPDAPFTSLEQMLAGHDNPSGSPHQGRHGQR